MNDFLNILEKAAAEEAQAQRLYAAMILLAPDVHNGILRTCR